MKEERLLERLRLMEKEPMRRANPDTGRTVDSVLKHLQRILNTRRGAVPIADDFGIPDFTGLLQSIPDSLREMEHSIRDTIQKFETRLSAVRVTFIPNDEDALSLRFQILARLNAPNQKEPVMFESEVDTDGKIFIKR
jgi:type VI secretion system protein